MKWSHALPQLSKLARQHLSIFAPRKTPPYPAFRRLLPFAWHHAYVGLGDKRQMRQFATLLGLKSLA
jgi:hypothetical protein